MHVRAATETNDLPTCQLNRLNKMSCKDLRSQILEKNL